MSHVNKANYIDYFTDRNGRIWFSAVYCKGCGEKVQDSQMIRSEGVDRPKLMSMNNYVDMFIRFKDQGGNMRRKSTPMCEACANLEWDEAGLQEIYDADYKMSRHNYEMFCECDAMPENKYSGETEKSLAKRKKGKADKQIGYVVTGYDIVGEGK